MADIFQHIASEMENMSKSQLKVAEYVLTNQTMVPFLNVSTLAANAGVSEATIVRFAFFLGFSGYPQLQAQFQEAIQKHLTTFERLEISNTTYNEMESKEKLQQFFSDDVERLVNTSEGINTEVFFQVVEEIGEAEKIFIAANRSSTGLGQLLQYYLDMLLGNSQLVHTMNGNLSRLAEIQPKDVIIGIGFPRYSSDTVDILKFAQKQGGITVALTDTLFSPLIPSAKYALLTPTRTNSFLDSYVGPLSIINALLVCVSQKNKEQVENRLMNLEKYWQEYGAFASGSGTDKYSDEK